MNDGKCLYRWDFEMHMQKKPNESICQSFYSVMCNVGSSVNGGY